jgi:hypothetical protein
MAIEERKPGGVGVDVGVGMDLGNRVSEGIERHGD